MQSTGNIRGPGSVGVRRSPGSYGSAKAESFGVAVPPGTLRRVERASALCAGALLSPMTAAAAARFALPAWVAGLPMLVVLAAIAVGANVSAVLRLRAVAKAVRRPSSAASPQASAASGSAPAIALAFGGAPRP